MSEKFQGLLFLLIFLLFFTSLENKSILFDLSRIFMLSEIKVLVLIQPFQNPFLILIEN